MALTVDDIMSNEDGEYFTRDGLYLVRHDDGVWTTTCGRIPHTDEEMRWLIQSELDTVKANQQSDQVT